MECPACHSQTGFSQVEKWLDYRLMCCGECGLTFSDPMRSASQEYYEAGEPYGWHWAFDYFLGQGSGEGRTLLDVACGNGLFLAAAARRGYAGTGIDFNLDAIREAKEVHGVSDVHACTFQEFRQKYPERRFDVITSFHTLEHLEAPDAFIAELKTLLAPAGRLIVVVPNPERWQVRYRRNLGDYPPNHLTRWTAKSLQTLLTRNGLQITRTLTEKIEPHSASDVLQVARTVVSLQLATGVIARQKAEIGLGAASGNGSKQKRLAMLRRLASLKAPVTGALSYMLVPVLYPYLRRRKLEGEDLVVEAAQGSAL